MKPRTLVAIAGMLAGCTEPTTTIDLVPSARPQRSEAERGRAWGGPAARAAAGGGPAARSADEGGQPYATSTSTATATATATATSIATSTSSGEVAEPCEDMVPGKMPAVIAPTVPPHLRDRALGFDTSTPAPIKTLRDAGMRFAYVQAAIGRKKNDTFAATFAMARRCGLPRGAYQLATAGADGAALAQVLLDVVGDDPGELPPTLDLETPPGCKDECCEESCATWIARATTWVDAVEAKTKRKPMIYLVEPFFSRCLCGTTKLAAHPLWLAAWPRFDFPAKPRIGGFPAWSLYQFEGNVLRFGGVIDLSLLPAGADPLASLRR